ncbi:hypothetical protein LINPERHAP1_LOCUS4240 [Linum perenne]
MAIHHSLLTILLITTSFLLTITSAAQNSTAPAQNSTQEPFSAATARAAPSAPRAVECDHESSRNVIRRCMTWIVTVGPPVNPTGVCCEAVRKARLMPCLCQYITRDMEDLVSVNKLVRLFNSCGKRVRPGTKCSSVIRFRRSDEEKLKCYVCMIICC